MKGNTVFWIMSLASAGLIVAGFLMPPTGVIDPSVFTGVGELFAFAALAKLPEALEKGHKVKVQKGDTKIEIGRRKEEVEEPLTETDKEEI